MIKVLFLLALAGGIKMTRKPYHAVAIYTLCLTLYIFLTSHTPFLLTLSVIAFQAALASLYTLILIKLLYYFHIDSGLFWWIALVFGLVIGIV